MTHGVPFAGKPSGHGRCRGFPFGRLRALELVETAGFELTGEAFLPGLMQLGHDVGMLRGEPVLKLIQGLDGGEDGRGNFQSSGFHDADGNTIPMHRLKCDLAGIFPDQSCG